MSDDEPGDELASIRHLLPNLDAGHLGDKFLGWQKFADALRIASEDYDCEVTSYPFSGYLRVDCAFAPPHIMSLACAVELATDQICQMCGSLNAELETQHGEHWKLCERCIEKQPWMPQDAPRA